MLWWVKISNHTRHISPRSKWEPDTGKELRRREGRGAPAAVSRDGTMVASLEPKRLLLWNAETGAAIRSWDAPTVREQGKEGTPMVEPTRPGPGQSTSEAAITELKKEIARRNQEAQKAARKRRAEREKEHLANLRKWERI